jgi:hypothetical protein
MPETEPTPPTPETKTYTNYTSSEHAFSLEYPKDWHFQEGRMGSIINFKGPFIQQENVTVNIDVASEKLPQFPKKTLEDYPKDSEMAENYKKVEEHHATVADSPAIVTTYTFSYMETMFMQTQAFFLKENTVYVITYSATPNSHEQYYDYFELVINSFKFLPAQSPEIPHYKITLVRFTGTMSGQFTGHQQSFFEGEFRNDSPVTLNYIEVVLTCYNKQGDVLGIDRDLVIPDVIRPGETGLFSLPATEHLTDILYGISFELPEPGILELSAESGVPTELFKPPFY